MTAGLASSLPATLTAGLTAQGVPLAAAQDVAQLPPVSTLFAAFLGSNPIAHLLEPSGVLQTLPANDANILTGTHFFPQLIAEPFHHGLVIVFTAAAAMAAIAAAASLFRGTRYIHKDEVVDRGSISGVRFSRRAATQDDGR